MTKKTTKKTPIKKVAKKTTGKKSPVKKKPIKRGKAGRSSHSIKKDLISALEATLGVVTSACSMVGVTTRSHYRYMKSDKKYAEDVGMVQNTALDFGETLLYKAMKKEKLAAIIFYLKTKGAVRGFSENMTVNQNVKSVGHITQNEPMDLETWEKLGAESLKNQDYALEQLLKARDKN